MRLPSTPSHQAQTDNEFQLLTQQVTDESFHPGAGFPVVPASISFSVLSNSAVLFRGQTSSGDDGVARVSIPSDLVVPAGAKLRVSARAKYGGRRSTIEIPLEPTRCLTYLTVDRPVYRPGETVFFRSLTSIYRPLYA